MMSDRPAPGADTPARTSPLLGRTVALIGLMGAGKSSVGKRLAEAIGAPFRDADAEIEEAAGMSIPEIFELHGEAAFRSGEERVIARLLAEPPFVLATGGGAYMSAATRDQLSRRAFTVWLRADLETLAARCGRRSGRPLLEGVDVRARLAQLMEERYPVYEQADAVIDSRAGPHERVVTDAMEALRAAGVLSD